MLHDELNILGEKYIIIVDYFLYCIFVFLGINK